MCPWGDGLLLATGTKAPDAEMVEVANKAGERVVELRRQKSWFWNSGRPGAALASASWRSLRATRITLSVRRCTELLL